MPLPCVENEVQRRSSIDLFRSVISISNICKYKLHIHIHSLCVFERFLLSCTRNQFKKAITTSLSNLEENMITCSIFAIVFAFLTRLNSFSIYMGGYSSPVCYSEYSHRIPAIVLHIVYRRVYVLYKMMQATYTSII